MNSKIIEYFQRKVEKDGGVQPSKVVEEASKESHILHDCFEWDDSKAGHQHRLWQARQLIKQYSVTIVEPEKKLFHVPCVIEQSPTREGVYRPAGMIVKSESEYDRALRNLVSQLRAIESSVDTLEAVAKAAKKVKAVKQARKVKQHIHSAQQVFQVG